MGTAKIRTADGLTFEVSEEFAHELLREKLNTPPRESWVDTEHVAAALTKRNREAWDLIKQHPEGLTSNFAGVQLGCTPSAAGQRYTTLINLGLVKRIAPGKFAPRPEALEEFK